VVNGSQQWEMNSLKSYFLFNKSDFRIIHYNILSIKLIHSNLKIFVELQRYPHNDYIENKHQSFDHVL
jgi:hypothetical protein